MNKLLELKNIYKNYENGHVKALNDISLEIFKGESISLMGPSGCGKTTLLNLIGTLDTPSYGDIYFNGIQIQQFKPFYRFRLEHIGFVFQFHYLIPYISISENIEIATYPHNLTSKERKKKTEKILDSLGLLNKKNCLPTNISGGERQRVAIGRAIINNPLLVLADEPTGNLDSKTGQEIIKLLLETTTKNGKTLIIATHNNSIANQTDRIINLLDGCIIKN